MALIFREPLLAPPPNRRSIAADVFPNLLLSTLAIVATIAPFSQSDWPTPTRARPAPQVDVAQNVTLRRKQPPKKGIAEWTQPVRARTAPAIEISPNVTLQLGLPIPPQIAQSDWSSPAPREPQRFDDPPNLLTATLGLVVSAVPPFSQSDWPTPTRARATPMPEVVDNWLTDNLIVTAPFFAPEEWQLQPPRRLQSFDQPPNLLTTQLAPIAAPLPPGDAWFDLSPARARQPRFDDPPNVALNSPIVATLPFSQDDQPLPPSRARSTPYAEVGPNTTAAGIPPALLPFSLDDWPITVRARWTASPDLAGATLRLPSGAGAPFNQDEWPTPTRARWIAADQPPNLQGSTLRSPALVLPFSLKDWPNPIRSRPGDSSTPVTDWLMILSPPSVIVLQGITPSREMTALESGRLVVSVNETRLVVPRPVKRLIS